MHRFQAKRFYTKSSMRNFLPVLHHHDGWHSFSFALPRYRPQFISKRNFTDRESRCDAVSNTIPCGVLFLRDGLYVYTWRYHAARSSLVPLKMLHPDQLYKSLSLSGVTLFHFMVGGFQWWFELSLPKFARVKRSLFMSKSPMNNQEALAELAPLQENLEFATIDVSLTVVVNTSSQSSTQLESTYHDENAVADFKLYQATIMIDSINVDAYSPVPVTSSALDATQLDSDYFSVFQLGAYQGDSTSKHHYLDDTVYDATELCVLTPMASDSPINFNAAYGSTAIPWSNSNYWRRWLVKHRYQSCWFAFVALRSFRLFWCWESGHQGTGSKFTRENTPSSVGTSSEATKLRKELRRKEEGMMHQLIRLLISISLPSFRLSESIFSELRSIRNMSRRIVIANQKCHTSFPTKKKLHDARGVPARAWRAGRSARYVWDSSTHWTFQDAWHAQLVTRYPHFCLQKKSNPWTKGVPYVVSFVLGTRGIGCNLVPFLNIGVLQSSSIRHNKSQNEIAFLRIEFCRVLNRSPSNNTCPILRFRSFLCAWIAVDVPLSPSYNPTSLFISMSRGKAYACQAKREIDSVFSSIVRMTLQTLHSNAGSCNHCQWANNDFLVI